MLKLATDESDNPDLRNRGYIYWRMLSNNPEMAKKIVLNEKPRISDDSGTIETVLLDKLIDNIGMLSSVYYKPPEQFVKKIRDRINERLDLENEDQVDLKQSSDYVDSTGMKRSEYVTESSVQNNYRDLLEVDEPSS